MATQADVREIALSLSGTREAKDRFGFSVEHNGKEKGFVWVWRERIDPKKARVPNPSVIAIRVADQTEKAMLLGSDTEKFFTEPHYNGYPAVLVRLAAVTKEELRSILVEAWRCQAPKALLEAPAPATRKPAAKRATKATPRKAAAKPATKAMPRKPAAKPATKATPRKAAAKPAKKRRKRG